MPPLWPNAQLGSKGVEQANGEYPAIRGAQESETAVNLLLSGLFRLLKYSTVPQLRATVAV